MFIGLKVANHLWHHGILPHIIPIELGQEVERVEVFDEIFNLAGPSMILEKYILMITCMNYIFLGLCASKGF